MSHIRHLFFDFFGTLVTHPSSFIGLHEHDASWHLLRKAGLALDYDTFIDQFIAMREQLEAWGKTHLREYSMAELVDQFCERYLPDSSPDVRNDFLHCYLEEWSQSVHHPLEVTAMLKRLHGHYSLSVISNCHHKPLVEQHLEKLGVTELLDDVMTSVEFGHRKPHPDIFSTALRRLEKAPQECLFIGDSYLPDYLGPSDAGITSWLIDPHCRYEIPEGHRLKCILSMETRLLQQRMAMN